MTDRSIHRLGTTLIGLVLGGVLLAGCSSSSSKPAAAPGPTTAAKASNAANAASSPVQTPQTTAAAAAGKTLTYAAACKVISTNLGAISRISTSANDPNIDAGIAKLRALQNTAPAPIRNDLKVVVDFDQRLVDAIRAGKSPESVAETPELDHALRHEAEWTAQHCVPSN